ncbi:hypothetical protein BOTBODRAFT_152197 [Botryobasidium botryosum FD-172 SS1]|uniref:serine--tRNA ligase n=1 Tax=Botryobasidium botryosum (strain FD-172 SS1) TaxID=930990 RepID=A0A067N6G1_BOTB1|nr:hypothetical protein BOTBODRAFT_152197 [Botryobasidium botryosum FD-172 SS1]
MDVPARKMFLRCVASGIQPRAGLAPTSTRRYSSKKTLDGKEPAQILLQSTLPKPRLDYRAIVENQVFKSHNAFNRKANMPVGNVTTVCQLYDDHREVSRQLNRKRTEQGAAGDRVRQIHDAQERKLAIEEAKALKGDVQALEKRLDDIDSSLLSLALLIPNDTHPDTPIGPEASAAVLSTRGPPLLPASPARDHMQVGRALGLLDLESASTVTGSSWYYLQNEGALLEIALVNYALSIAIKHGFKPVLTPDVVKSDVAYRCGFQPRDPDGAAQNYHLERVGSEPELVLAGTAEIPLAGLFASKVYDERDMPIKVVGVGKAFRAEAGARGADTRGLYRVHQFTKVELFAVTVPESSDSMMEEIAGVQKDIFDGLGFPYRVLDMPTEELGASAYRKYDMEAWMPGRGRWGEISSTSNCTDYQSRRLHARYRPLAPLASEPQQAAHQPALPFVHTLNGTAAAIPRLIVAILENGARFQGNTVVGLNLPAVLRPYWLGVPPNEAAVGIEWVDELRIAP